MKDKEVDVLIDFIKDGDWFDSICDKLMPTGYCEKCCEKRNLEHSFDKCVREYARVVAKEREECKE